MNRSMKQMLSMLLVVAMMAAMLVIPSAATTNGAADTYKVVADAITVEVGKTAKGTAQLVYGVNNDTYLLDKDATYEVVSDATYVVVSDTYVLGGDTVSFTVKGVKAGEYTVKVTINGYTADVKVTVKDAEKPSETPSDKPSQKPDDTLKFAVTDKSAGTYAEETKIGSVKGVDIYVSADKFTYKTDDWSAKTDYAGYIVGGANGKFDEKAPAVPTGCYYKFVVSANGTLKVDYLVNAEKDLYVLDKFGDSITVLQHIAKADMKEKNNGTATIEAKGNHTYYVLCTGSKLCFYGISFKATGGAVEPIPTTKPSENPSEKPSETPEMTVYTVKPDAAKVTVRENATKTVKVTTEPAGVVYAVSADTKTATVTVANNTLTIKGVKAGKTTVTVGVKDGKGAAEVAVTVSASGGLAPSGGSGSTTTKPTGDYTAKKSVDRNGNLTITVTDKNGEVVAKVEIPATIPTLETKFVDVPDDHWAAKSINALAALGMVKGVNEAEHLYDMNSNVTRGSLATILFRLAQAKGATSDFTDVAKDAWYADAVGWAAKVGIIAGKGDNTFGADESITREQLALMLYRFAKLLGVDTRATGDVAKFADGASTSDWAKEAMTWAVGAGILQGNTANELKPNAAASRAETACMVDRFISLLK